MTSNERRESWDAALAQHHETGDYVPLGIWAQDNVPQLLEQQRIALDHVGWAQFNLAKGNVEAAQNLIYKAYTTLFPEALQR